MEKEIYSDGEAVTQAVPQMVPREEIFLRPGGSAVTQGNVL